MTGSTVRPPAYQQLADDLRAEITSGRLQPGEVVSSYLDAVDGDVGQVRDDEIEGAAVQVVSVRGADGATTGLRVLNEDGPRVCGIAGRAG